MPDMPLIHFYCSQLENDFLLINWDQRGAGKSYSPFIQKRTMTLNQFIQDGSELINYLLKKFLKQRLHLIGHSWGSALGLLIVQKHPNLLLSYTGIGQVGDWAKGEQVSYQYTLDHAIAAKNKMAVKALKRIGPPPHTWKALIQQRRLLLKFNGATYGRKNYNHLIPKYIFSKEYSLVDLIKFLLGLRFSLKHLWSEITQINLCLEVPEVKIPIHFMLGRHDYQVPFECSIQYYDLLKAPSKTISWFDKSGHTPMYEEPEVFVRELTNYLKKIAK